MEPLYLIWSIEHNGWWMANKRGYTQYKIKAGAYTFEDAKKIVEEANRFTEDTPNESLVPLTR